MRLRYNSIMDSKRFELELMGIAACVLGCALYFSGCTNPADSKRRTAPPALQDGGAARTCSLATCEGTCCDSVCVNSQNDVNNCGGCGITCASNEVCASGMCLCIPGTENCEDNSGGGDEEEEVDDCELTDSCPCTIGEERSCYEGPEGTEGVGACHSGTQICSSAGWSPCTGQTIPRPEDCENNAIDEDCNGIVDDDSDWDQDGWTRCGGDCCDSDIDQCDEPALVNPGAYEFINGIDDDCDGTTDNSPLRDCSTSTITSGVTSSDLAQAMDLCTTTTVEANTWGIIDTALLRSDGTGTPDPLQVGVLTAFGSLIPAQENNTLSVLSSGRARGVDDDGFESDTSYSAVGSSPTTPPAAYMNSHQNLQSSPLCPSAEPQTQDSVQLRITMRVPTNAKGLEYKFRFFSFEYPMYLCSQYNDFYLALLTSSHDMIPEDKNISFCAAGNPVTINSAFFTSCDPIACNDPTTDQIGPDADGDGCVDSLICNPETNLCETEYGACPDGSGDVRAFTDLESTAGGTAWLTTTAPVIPGEIITLEFHIWDTTDSALDSTVLLDAFRWRAEPTGLTTNKQ